jgi:UDP-N-acetylmuramyl pentapeptide phosphotransferase/UDP-N-acetylglucosamine-1-phosphate transferase
MIAINNAVPLAVPLAVAALVAALLSFLVARTVAGSTRLLDIPGPRSSHSRPTPRGGGLGIVLVGLGAIPALAFVDLWPMPWVPAFAAFALVAAVGALDDIRHRPVLLRLLAHLAAAAMLVIPLSLEWYATALSWPVVAAVVIALIWSINLHNFMDGIDGILTLQALWSWLAYAALFALAAQPASALFALLLAAAAAGFLPMNWPRARVFLGDGASGFIGLSIGWLALYGAIRGAVSLPESLIIASAFLVDSSATLLRRVLRGERVWEAHRDHLYQHLLRGGRSHASVGGWYMLWNLLVALPALLVAREFDTPMERWIVAAAVLAAGLVAWVAARWPSSSRNLVEPG